MLVSNVQKGRKEKKRIKKTVKEIRQKHFPECLDFNFQIESPSPELSTMNEWNKSHIMLAIVIFYNARVKRPS